MKAQIGRANRVCEPDALIWLRCSAFRSRGFPAAKGVNVLKLMVGEMRRLHRDNSEAGCRTRGLSVACFFPFARGKQYLHLFSIFLLLFFVAAPAGGAGVPQPARSGRLLIASDIHFNPFTDPALVAALQRRDASKWEEILDRSGLKDYSRYSQDTNWWLLESALNAMRAAVPRPAVIMITGDLLAHNFPQLYRNATQDSDQEHYRDFVTKTVEFIGLELRQRFGDSQVLITPGNNDDDCGDYQIEAGGAFLTGTAAVVASLARAGGDFLESWQAMGDFALQPKEIPGVRIIGLNTVFFSPRYRAADFEQGCSAVDSAAAEQNLAWLAKNLAQAKAADKKVWLMSHIPPGIDGYATMMHYRGLSRDASVPSDELCRDAIVPAWDPVWTSQFVHLAEEFQGTITASFAGHTHADDYRIYGGNGGLEGFTLINPPVSPVYGQNPAFRVVTFLEDGRLRDQSTYYLTNLSTAKVGSPGRWRMEYRFAEAWGQPQLDAAGMSAISKKISQSPAARAQWLKFYDVSSPAAKPPLDGAAALLCAGSNLDPESYQKCYCPLKETLKTAPKQ